jgi:dihydrodipicolinate synthase/N-acetylneuraminate lyase
MSIDGIFDATNTITGLQDQLEFATLSAAEREKIENRVAGLTANRTSGYAFVLENAEQLRAVVKDLEPIARFSFDRVENAVRRTNT